MAIERTRIREAVIEQELGDLSQRDAIAVDTSLGLPETLVEESLASVLSGNGESLRAQRLLDQASDQLKQTAAGETPRWPNRGIRSVSDGHLIISTLVESGRRRRRAHDALVNAFLQGHASLAEVALEGLRRESAFQRTLRPLLPPKLQAVYKK